MGPVDRSWCCRVAAAVFGSAAVVVMAFAAGSVLRPGVDLGERVASAAASAGAALCLLAVAVSVWQRR